jgi:ATP synthase protein I
MVQGRLPAGSGTGPSLSNDGGVAGYLLAGICLFGGLGLLMDHWLGVSFLTPVGLVMGAAAGGYLIFVRVVREPKAAPAEAPGGSGTDNANTGESW